MEQPNQIIRFELQFEAPMGLRAPDPAFHEALADWIGDFVEGNVDGVKQLSLVRL